MSTPFFTKQKEFEVCPTDIVIALLGTTGVGKSNFIERVAQTAKGTPIISSGSTKSATKEVTAYRIMDHPKYASQIVLVDTPGFDDSNLTDLDVLKMISKWLTTTYGKYNVLLSGVFYLHRITDNRVSGSAFRSLTMLGQLCGEEAAKKITMVTTRWDDITTSLEKQEQAKVRLAELETVFWKHLVDKGTKVAMFMNDEISANRILDCAVKEEHVREVLHLQEEMVDRRRAIKNTDAGRVLYKALKGSARTNLPNSALEDPDANDLEAEIQRNLKQISDLKELKPGVFPKLLSAIGLRKTRTTAFKDIPHHSRV